MHVTSFQIQIAKVGHQRLDDDHDEFLCLIAELRGAVGDALLPAFDALYAHARAHFAIEDSLMAPHEFASKDCHLDEHMAVLNSFADVRAEIADGRLAVVTRFVDHLSSWLPEHVDALDRHLAKLIFFRQTGGAAIVLRR